MRSRLLLVLAVMLMALALPAAAVASTGEQLGWSPSLSSFASASSEARAADARPVITRLSLSAAKPGARLTISGRGFGARRGKGNVLFGVFKGVSYVRWSARKIVCKVPVIPAAKLTIKVRTAKGTSNGKRFTVKALPTVVPDTTEVLSTDTAASASTTDGATYSFANTSQTSSLKPGDVVIGKPTATVPEGIFRKVTAVADGGASVTTEPATLEDTFKSAQFSGEHVITQSDFTGSVVAPGVRLVRSRAQRQDVLTFRLISAGITSDASADFGPVSVSGTITLKITMHVGGAIDWGGVKSFETSEITTVSSDLRAAVSLTQPFKAEKTLVKWGVGKIAGFTVMVGPVPLYFQPELSIVVGVSGELSMGVQTSVHEEFSGGIGLTYQSGKFTPWTKFTTASHYEPPTLYRSCSAKVYAGAHLSLKLYAAAGPYIKLDGYAKLAADTSKTPWWKLSAGVEASMGAEVGGDYGFIDWKLDWHTNTFIIKEWPLTQATTPAPTPSPTPTPTPTPTIAPTPSPPPSGLAIGDAYGGGVVAYILQPGDPGYVAGQTHGLIAATADQSTIAASTATAGSASVAPPAGWIAWWSGNYMVTGATATELGTGLANTDLIIAAQGAPATDYAAGLARSCNGGGYTDWYLPSRDELNKLFLNKNAIGGFEAAIYWSSSEDDADDAWLQNFVTVEQFWDYKDNACKVRPVRAF